MQVKRLVLLVQCVALCAAYGHNHLDARDGEIIDDSGGNSTNTTTTSSSSTSTTTSTTTSLTTLTSAATSSSDSTTDTTTTVDSSDSSTSTTSSDDDSQSSTSTSSSDQSTSQSHTTTTTSTTSTALSKPNNNSTSTTTSLSSTVNSTTLSTTKTALNTTTTAAPTALNTSSSLFNSTASTTRNSTTSTTSSTSRCGVAGSFATPPSYATKAKSIDDCKAACSARGASCKSFEAGTVDGDGNNCWLFAHSLSDMSIGSVQAGFSWTFYDKDCDVTSRCGIQGSFITAPIDMLKVATLAACKDACAKNTRCQTFEAGSVDGSGNNCWLFDSSITALSIGGATTGWRWAFFDKDCDVSS